MQVKLWYTGDMQVKLWCLVKEAHVLQAANLFYTYTVTLIFQPVYTQGNKKLLKPQIYTTNLQKVKLGQSGFDLITRTALNEEETLSYLGETAICLHLERQLPCLERDRLIVYDVSEYENIWPNPVAAWFKAWVCGLSLAGIAGSNLAGGIDVCLL
jgi:hypothetical protein